MKFTMKRTSAAAATLFAGSLILTACSNADNNDNGGSNGAESTREMEEATGELRGEGASSQDNAIQNIFGPAFSNTGATLAYTASGSGDGQKKFIAGQADFAGSDSPLKDDQIADAKKRCEGNDAWHLPMVIGPVAIAYHLEGVDTLNLSTKTVAKIFKGEIKKWDDEAIKSENEGVDLPSKPIEVVYRSDESGTSDNFQKFLAASTGEWDSEGKQFPTKVGTGAPKSKGVADQVAQTDGAITYVESGFAEELDKVNVANIDFGAGPVELNKENVNKALNAAEFKGEGNDLVVDSKKLYSLKGEGAYPLVLTTYEIVCSAGYDEATSKMVKDFLNVALDSQDDELAAEGFIPVKGAHAERLREAINAIK